MEVRDVSYVEVNGDTIIVNVDVCPKCAGLWIDGTDGDLRTLTRSVLVEEPTALEGGEDEDARPICPRDGAWLDLDFSVKGAVVFRCETCSGAFLSRPQAERLAVSGPGDMDMSAALQRLKSRKQSP